MQLTMNQQPSGGKDTEKGLVNSWDVIGQGGVGQGVMSIAWRCGMSTGWQYHLQ